MLRKVNQLEHLDNLDGVGDGIEFTTTSVGDVTTLGTVLLGDELGLFEGLEGETNVTTSSNLVVRLVTSGGQTRTTEVLSEGTNTDTGVKVDLTEDGSKTNVVPVFVDGGELLESTGLDKIGVLGEGELVRGVLEVSSKSSNELVGGNITDGRHTKE